MPQINQLSAVDTLNSGDQIPVFITSCGDARKAAMSVVLAYIQRNLSSAGFITQYAAPSATGFSVAIDSVDDSVWLILTPGGSYAAGTIVLPAYPGADDGQEVLVNCTQSVASLSITANGATAVTGAPTSLAANGFFRLRFDLLTRTWYRTS